MSATMTLQLKDSTVDVIHELVEGGYHDQDIYNFIKEYGEEYLENYYEDYCDMGETYSYEAVDVFCEEFGVDTSATLQMPSMVNMKLLQSSVSTSLMKQLLL